MSILPAWERLRHGGLLFDGTRLEQLSQFVPPSLDGYTEGQLRQRANAVLDGSGDQSRFVAFVLEGVCGLNGSTGIWTRGSSVAPAWGGRGITGENVKPRHLWKGRRGAVLPVFLDDGKRLGIGRGRRIVSHVLGWLRAGGEHLALLTNGRQWRLLFAGLDYDAWCEWDLELWFDKGELAPQVTALRTLLNPELWTPASKGSTPRLLQAIRDTRKGQAELSEVLGERVREAVEMLIQAHGEPLRAVIDQTETDGAAPDEIYRAACRVAMRLVVTLFAESRDLLPRDNPLYHDSYGLNGLLDQLEREGGSLADSFAAWPRILALFKLVRDGSHHPVLPEHAYGGELFVAGDEDGQDGVSRALAVFEQACSDNQVLSDHEVRKMLRRITRTTIRIRQGRGGIRAVVPVDFSDLSSEYLGILYEGLLDYELKTAPADDPVVFLSVGDQPALPLSRLEAMDDSALKALFESLKKNKPADQDEVSEEDAGEEVPELDIAGADAPEQESEPHSDERSRDRTRAEKWARRAAQVAGLVRKRRGSDTPERRLAYEHKLGEEARRLVARVILPGEWYLVRWSGTRKGSGSFYTRPGLAVPTVQRTLRPLAFDPPVGSDGKPDTFAPPARWTPKVPEQILGLTVCDPACGSGTFPLAALRFLTDALYASLQHHRRIEPDGARALVRLLGSDDGERPAHERLADELIPCRPDDDNFEPRLKAVLRRHVVERCIYAVDLDPLAVELCRLSLWIETMDRTLPFGFLDHKVKCGNSLIGAWFDQFQHYPVMAWKNREGGDNNHSNGVHLAKGARTKEIKAFAKERLAPDLKRFLQGRDLFQEDMLQSASTAHDEALAVLAEMHALPVQDAAERARRYREDLLGSAAWRSLKEAMDLWCSCWFWPADEISCAPLPTTLASPTDDTRRMAAQVAAEMRFFHWELEFPEIFRESGSGFHAILGNPPWDIAKPNSMEFGSGIDPLYRSYGKQEAIRRQSAYFDDEAVEHDWLDYNARFRAQSNFTSYAASPFGDPDDNDKSQDRFSLSRGYENKELHARWRRARRRTVGFGDPEHPFRRQGSADLNLYKLFLEAAHTLLKPAGRLGFVVPSEDWLFDTTAGPERRQAEAQLIHGHLLKPGDVARTNWRVRCAQPPYDRLPIPRADIPPGFILSRDCESWIPEDAIKDTAWPLYEGRMIGQFDFSQNGWVSGRGRAATWREIRWGSKQIEPQFLMRATDYELEASSPWSPKLAHMDIGSATNMRSAIGTFLCGMTAGNSAPTFHLSDASSSLNLTAVFNSVTFDFITRLRVTALHLNYHVIEQNPLPRPLELSDYAIAIMTRRLCLTGRWFAPRMLNLPRGDIERSALIEAERLRLGAALDTLVAVSFGLDVDELSHILKDCERNTPTGRDGLDPKGFWRGDKEKDPELRHTVLTLIAFQDLEAKIGTERGDRELGIKAFLAQNAGEGWMLPETVRVADYALGHDDRARRRQLVAARLGARLYDWKFVPSADEADRESHLHARNLLGSDGYARLLASLIEGRTVDGKDGLHLLANRITRGLLGRTGDLAGLLDARTRSVIGGSIYWAAIKSLRVDGYLDRHLYAQLLDTLSACELGDGPSDDHRLGRAPWAPHAVVASEVDQPATIYEPGSAKGSQQPGWFDSCLTEE